MPSLNITPIRQHDNSGKVLTFSISFWQYLNANTQQLQKLKGLRKIWTQEVHLTLWIAPRPVWLSRECTTAPIAKRCINEPKTWSGILETIMSGRKSVHFVVPGGLLSWSQHMDMLSLPFPYPLFPFKPFPLFLFWTIHCLLITADSYCTSMTHPGTPTLGP